MPGEPVRGEGRFTWRDYRAWPDEKRWEIIGGEAFAMTPAPTPRHQWVCRAFTVAMGNFFKGHECALFPAPTDLKLSDGDIVQPDLLVVCDRSQIRRTHIEGAPTLVVEVLSPSTSVHDRMRKTALYARAGVEELWLVTPYPSLVEVYALDGSAYRLVRVYQKGDALRSPTFPELEITLDDAFDFPIEPDEEIMLVKEGAPPYASGSSAGG